MSDCLGKVAILWRGDRETRAHPTPNDRLAPVFRALAAAGVVGEPVVYCDAVVEEVRDELLDVDGVLVWVDPIGGGENRTTLDAMLREVSLAGVWISAHPETILRMGTKEVLYRTRQLGWGTDTHLYPTFSAFVERFPARLATGQPRVLKQNRGNGGNGVWRVELVTNTVPSASSPTPSDSATVRVQHAQPRDASTEDLALGTFMSRCQEYFADDGRLIDQPFMPRISKGMIRAYLVVDQVVGFARQQPQLPSTSSEAPPPDRILGLPSAKTMYDAAEPEFDTLKSKLEREWVPGLQSLVDVETAALPLLWDADFLYGPRRATGADVYVLCEINVSSVSPFPPHAVDVLTQAVVARLGSEQS